MRYVNLMLLSVLFFIIPTAGFAGSLNDLGAPDNAASAMYTVTDVYNRINDGTAGTKRTTTFGEPSAAPGQTGKTLNDLYGIASERSRSAKTGQTISYRPHDDGNLQKGVSWPSPRFTDNADGTVTDNLTGLIWLKNADCAGEMVDWNTAVDYCAALYDGCINCFGTAGDCGLSDSSVAGEWRLPNVKELQSLIDFGKSDPALPSGNPFSGVVAAAWWSSTTYADHTSAAWYVSLMSGGPGGSDKSSVCVVWPVRGGQ